MAEPEYAAARVEMKERSKTWLAGALSSSGMFFLSQKTMKLRRLDTYVVWVSTSQARAMTASIHSRSSSVSCEGLVATIYIMYSRQLPWGILISYRKWNEINFISFTANISFLILNAISFLHSVYFIFSKFYFIHSRHVFHSPTAFVSFTCGMYLILPQHLFHL